MWIEIFWIKLHGRKVLGINGDLVPRVVLEWLDTLSLLIVVERLDSLSLLIVVER